MIVKIMERLVRSLGFLGSVVIDSYRTIGEIIPFWKE